jgi:uncharacterized protein YmfQ (DUF2313 family)
MIVIDHWNRYYGFTSEEETEDTIVRRRGLKLNYKCGICSGTLVEYPPGQHDVDEWHIACAQCGNTEVFIHSHEVAQNKHKAQELIDALDPEAQGDVIKMLQQAL